MLAGTYELTVRNAEICHQSDQTGNGEDEWMKNDRMWDEKVEDEEMEEGGGE